MQSEELQLLCSLGREAAEILWEMAALQNETEATKEMLEKAEQLKVNLDGRLVIWTSKVYNAPETGLCHRQMIKEQVWISKIALN